jgi:orotate phosphoribosyltransferase
LSDTLDQFRKTNALLEGHFVLSSGLHSPMYLQCALALQDSMDAVEFGREIAKQVIKAASDTWVSTGIDTVASPAIGGLIIGFAVAQALGTRFIWTERENGAMTLRRGFSVDKGERILIVEDVITTGGSTRECIAALKKYGANIIGAASIVDRSSGKADVGVPRVSLVSLNVPSYDPTDCPLCVAGIEALKPGSRTSK